MAEPDLEAHLCALILRREQPEWAAEPTAKLLASIVPSPTRSHDVAMLGVRRALGVAVPNSTDLVRHFRRELNRQPLPPAARAHDDERLMLGIAAGVGTLPELRETMAGSFACARGRSKRWDAILLFARWLAAGLPDTELANETSSLISRTVDRPLTFADAVVLSALSAELLDTTVWAPNDKELAAFGVAQRSLQRAIVMDAPLKFDPLDAAMALRGLAVAPAERLERRSMIDSVLTVIDAFPASIQLLTKRPRRRRAITVKDEYDVQWLTHVMLLPVIPDLVPEDPAPRLAGASSRLDFTSKKAKLGIEIKFLHKKGDVPKVREELMIDERQYQEHPYVESVVAFVYDPNEYVTFADRVAFERDLGGPIAITGRTVTYVTRIK